MNLTRSCLILTLTCVAALPAAERVALVVGNAKYEGDAVLSNPANDATAVEAALKELNFKVTKQLDLDLPQMEAAIVEFHRSLKKGDAALFFYAGHGLQVKGENFLVPLKANPQAEFQVKEKCYKLDQVLSALEESEAGIKIVILDCCRDNPFTRGWNRGGTQKGLAAVPATPDGTLIAFSTAPGKTALDAGPGSRKNSPYTTQLVAGLKRRPAEGLELTEALREAGREVKDRTGQTPWINFDASLDKFYLWQPNSIRTLHDLLQLLEKKHPETSLLWSTNNGRQDVSIPYSKDDLKPDNFAVIERDFARRQRILQLTLHDKLTEKFADFPQVDIVCNLAFARTKSAEIGAANVHLVNKFREIDTLSFWGPNTDGGAEYGPLNFTLEATKLLKAEIKSLRALNFFGSLEGVSKEEFDNLMRIKSLQAVQLFGSAPDTIADGIAAAAELRDLKHLDLRFCKCGPKTKAALERLREARPFLTIDAPEE